MHIEKEVLQEALVDCLETRWIDGGECGCLQPWRLFVCFCPPLSRTGFDLVFAIFLLHCNALRIDTLSRLPRLIASLFVSPRLVHRAPLTLVGGLYGADLDG